MFLIYSFFDARIDNQVKGGILPGTAVPEEEFHLSDFVKLITDKSFIYITLLCVTFYAAVFPFIQYAPDMLINKFGFTAKLPPEGSVMIFGSEALGIAAVYIVLFVFALSFSIVPSRIANINYRRIFTYSLVTVFGIIVFNFWGILQIWLHNGSKTASLIPLGTIVFTPIFGNIVDRKGKAASLMMLGSCLLIFAHLSLSLSNSVTLGYMALVSLGIAFALVPAAMWPSVAKIVPENRLGTAYATMFTVQNWGLGFFFWGIGAVLDLVNHDNLPAIREGKMTYNYTIPIMMLVVCGIISIFLASMLKKADAKQAYGLELPSGAKK
jgi:hypothetical protein